MTSVTIDEAKAQFADLIEQVARGEEVTITRDDKPVTRLVPYVLQLPKRGFGSMRGKAWLNESFWEPLPEEELKLWEGGCRCRSPSGHDARLPTDRIDLTGLR